jgi:hypothetical protein
MCVNFFCCFWFGVVFGVQVQVLVPPQLARARAAPRLPRLKCAKASVRGNLHRRNLINGNVFAKRAWRRIAPATHLWQVRTVIVSACESAGSIPRPSHALTSVCAFMAVGGDNCSDTCVSRVCVFFFNIGASCSSTTGSSPRTGSDSDSSHRSSASVSPRQAVPSPSPAGTTRHVFFPFLTGICVYVF